MFVLSSLFLLSTKKYFESFPSNNKAALFSIFSESFALTLYISTLLTNKYSPHYNANLNNISYVAQ